MSLQKLNEHITELFKATKSSSFRTAHEQLEHEKQMAPHRIELNAFVEIYQTLESLGRKMIADDEKHRKEYAVLVEQNRILLEELAHLKNGGVADGSGRDDAVE